MEIERVKLKFKVISPVHIGTKVRVLSPLDYVEGPDGFVYVLKEGKLLDALEENGAMEEFLRGISSPGFDLSSFLRSKGLLTREFLSSISSYRVLDLSEGLGAPSPIVRNPWGKPFVPGSSVKGAMRTAVLFKLLSRDEKGVEEHVRRKLERLSKMKGRRRAEERKKLASDLEKEMLRSLCLPGRESKGEPHTDFLRCLRVSDSNPLDEEAAALLSAEVIEPRGGKAIEMRVECLKVGVEFEIELSLDMSLMKEFSSANPGSPLPFTGVEDVLECVRAFGERLWKTEGEFASAHAADEPFSDLSDFYSKAPSGVPIRIGWGSGILGTTIDLLLSEELRRELGRELFGSKHPRFPWSRRVVYWDGRCLPLGWVELSF
ncbi:type III-A CRISPR-associated RAMP protein Csm5 [Candidatus Poribacteria bacterium]|nr:MAG: type III-A CRISPR-associated RAMP protein Csm5 [Candidatus Poribacteria bacterium]